MRLRLVMLVVVLIATAFATGQVAALPQKEVSHVAAWARGTPDAVVRELYREVVARKPLGLPGGADWPALQPFLSNELIRRIDTARACQDDLFRQMKGLKGIDSTAKAPLAWDEAGLFSGPYDDANPSEAVVGRAEPAGNGSFRVWIRLTWRSDDNSWQWSVCAVVTSEDEKTSATWWTTFFSSRTKRRRSRRWFGPACRIF
jgi:hypothetical protein